MQLTRDHKPTIPTEYARIVVGLRSLANLVVSPSTQSYMQFPNLGFLWFIHYFTFTRCSELCTERTRTLGLVLGSSMRETGVIVVLTNL